MGGQNVKVHRRVVRHHHLPVESGLLVVHLERGGPGERAGLRDGDVIVEFGGRPVTGIDALHKLLTEETIGKVCPLVVVRHAEKMNLEIVPAESQLSR